MRNSNKSLYNRGADIMKVSNKNYYVLDEQLLTGMVRNFVLETGAIKYVKDYDDATQIVYFKDGSMEGLSDLINHMDYYNLDDGVKAKNKSKSVSKKQKPNFSIYSLAKGKPGKKFTIKEFLEITSKDKKPGGHRTSYELKLDNGYVYKADSKQEISTLKKLISHDAFKRLKGQCISIPYRFGGKDHLYYPDFIFLTNTNKIIILEVKEVAQMNTKVNIKKYEALKRYCLRNGYLYLMCNKNFVTYEELSKRNGNGHVNSIIDKALDEKGNFNYSDYKLLIENQTKRKIKKIRDAISIYVSINKSSVKQIGDLYFESERFRIIRRKNKE